MNLPFESLTIGFIELKDVMADGVALLIADSSFLKRLTVRDIIIDQENLESIMMLAVRNKHAFEKFKIDLREDHNDFGIENCDNKRSI